MITQDFEALLSATCYGWTQQVLWKYNSSSAGNVCIEIATEFIYSINPLWRQHAVFKHAENTFMKQPATCTQSSDYLFSWVILRTNFTKRWTTKIDAHNGHYSTKWYCKADDLKSCYGKRTLIIVMCKVREVKTNQQSGIILENEIT